MPFLVVSIGSASHWSHFHFSRGLCGTDMALFSLNELSTAALADGALIKLFHPTSVSDSGLCLAISVQNHGGSSTCATSGPSSGKTRPRCTNKGGLSPCLKRRYGFTSRSLT